MLIVKLLAYLHTRTVPISKNDGIKINKVFFKTIISLEKKAQRIESPDLTQ